MLVSSANAKALERLALQRPENCGKRTGKTKSSLEEMLKRSEEDKVV
jgi:hypothetical protein